MSFVWAASSLRSFTNLAFEVEGGRCGVDDDDDIVFGEMAKSIVLPCSKCT